MVIEAAAHWRERLARAESEHDLHTLAEIILVAESRLLPAYLIDQPHPLPYGRPPGLTVKAAGRALLNMLDEVPREDAWAWEALAHQAAYRYSRNEAGDVDEKLAEHTSHLEHALKLAQGNDALLELLLLEKLATRYRDVFAYQLALNAAHEMLGILDREDAVQPSVLERMIGNPGIVRPLPEALATFRVHAHERASVAARNLRNYNASAEHRDRQAEAAEALMDHQPNLLCGALGQRAALARTMGDIHTNDDCLQRQRSLAKLRPWWLTDSIVQRSMSDEAGFFADYDTARRCELERLMTRVTGEGFTLESATPASAAVALRQIHDANRQSLLTAIGNIAYNLAANLLQSGRCRLDPDARSEARQWLDVAEDAWRNIAMNGLYAIEFRRLQLDILDGQASPPLEVGRKMVDLSRRWRRPGGQLRAALMATVEGAPADTVVLDRLLELQQDAPPIDVAHLNVGVARWHLRAGHAALSVEELAGALEHWQQAAAAGAVAADGLAIPRPGQPPVLLNAQRYIDALTIQADAQRQLRLHDASTPGQDPAPTAAAELATRLRSLPAIARRVSASGTPIQRRATADLYARPLSTAVELAIELDAYDAVDAICEVVRRDAAGVILAGMVKDPDTPDKVAQLARELTAALQASIDPSSDEPGMAGASEGTPKTSEGDGEERPPAFDLGQRAATIEDQLAGTLDVMGSIVGPVARAIFDPTDVTSSTAERLLGYPSSPQAVLSLWLRDDNQLVRHLTWRTDHGVGHVVDCVRAPEWLPALTAADTEPAHLMAALDNLPSVLFPLELQHQLTALDPDHPLDLMIVPTGLFGIPLAAVPVTRQYLLVDLATITIVQSLTAAHALARGSQDFPATPPRGPLAVYDNHLTHAEREFEDLRKYHREVYRVTSLGELATELGAEREPGWRGMFVLALHGLRGGDGWSQTKVMPNGELLRTAHILEWHIPTLVVGASCDTDIRADDGGDLGGFPLAFQMKGARLVIGTLTRVDDEATAEIMGLFYAAVAAQLSPARALRHAQRTYFSALGRKQARHLWAFHIAYGYSDSQPSPHTETTGGLGWRHSTDT